MQKFITSLIYFSLPVILLFGLIEYALRNIPNDYAVKNNFLEKNSNQLEVLFLGSSHAFRGINPKFIITKKSYNASYVSQSFDMDYQILMKYKKKWNSLKTIVLPISYFSLFSNLKTSTESWRVKNYCIYYHLFVSNHPSDYLELLNIDIKTNLNRIKSYYIYHKNPITADENGFGKFIGTDELTKSGLTAAKRHTKKNYQLFLENQKTLAAIIDFSKKRGIDIIFYTPPAYQTYSNHLNKNQLNLTFSVLNRIINKHKNTHYFNFLNDSNFVANDFYNADHLNETGAKKLTQLLNSKIELSH